MSDQWIDIGPNLPNSSQSAGGISGSGTGVAGKLAQWSNATTLQTASALTADAGGLTIGGDLIVTNNASFGGSVGMGAISVSGSAGTWTTDAAGNFLPSPDGALNIGANGTINRVGSIFAKTDIWVGASAEPRQIILEASSASGGYSRVHWRSGGAPTDFWLEAAADNNLSLLTNGHTTTSFRFNSAANGSVCNLVWPDIDGSSDIGSPDSGTTLQRPRNIFLSSSAVVAGPVKLGSVGSQHTIQSSTATSNQVGTLTNSITAGNPAGYLKIVINGIISYIPYWQ